MLDAEGMRREMGRASESGGTWWRASGLVGSCSAEAEEGDGGRGGDGCLDSVRVQRPSPQPQFQARPTRASPTMR